MGGKTLYDKIWDAHAVKDLPSGDTLLYIDFHLVQEVSSPQAFAGLREAGRKVRRPELTLAVEDHSTPTENQGRGPDAAHDEAARLQLRTLHKNVADFGIEFFPMNDARNGIVHVVGPEQGRTQPGTTIVCGDSHTSTHGAFGALAHGIGTSEVEHVLATQTLRSRKMKNFRVVINGKAAPGVGGKDMALAFISQVGTAGGTGSVIEYQGEAVRALSMEGRMSLCNMSIEAGARAGLVAPDDTTFAYLKGRPAAPKGEAWDEAVERWKTYRSDDDATFDKTVELDASEIAPLVTWGTSPQDVATIVGKVPSPDDFNDPDRRQAAVRALDYMGLNAGQNMQDVSIDAAFIGSCTNSRIEDLRQAAAVVKGRKVATHVRAMVVPGSGLVRAQAEQEGLDDIFLSAGFEWREPGCSMCVGLNADRLKPGQRCASTSNRNFEGRQGRGGRTHLMSPAMVAAAAVTGRLTDVREFI